VLRPDPDGTQSGRPGQGDGRSRPAPARGPGLGSAHARPLSERHRPGAYVQCTGAEQEPCRSFPRSPSKIAYRSSDRRCSDNPRALPEAILARDNDGIEHVWLCAEGHAGEFAPDTATAPEDEPEAVAALESTDLVVSNTHLSMDWTKRSGATYLQTWHGPR
jgi:hypothetical protein